MAFDQSYSDVDTYLARKGSVPFSDGSDFQRITDLLLSASRAVDAYCHRAFGSDGDTRVYTAVSPRLVEIDDLVSLASIEVDLDRDLVCETVWSLADSYLVTLPAYLLPGGAPSIALRLAPLASRGFPTTPRAISITGTFGWPSVPAPIKEATLRLALRLDKMPEAPLGIAEASSTVNNTSGGTRLITPADQDVERLLAPYVRQWGPV